MPCLHNQLEAVPTILFAELEPWERDQLKALCPEHCTLLASSDRLEAIDDDTLSRKITIFSPFIHSTVGAEQLDRLPDLKLIATRSTGFDHIDLNECEQRGLLVANVPHYGEDTVAEHVFGMLLALTRKIHRCYERTSRGDFSIEGLRGIDVAGKTFGCLGVGAIGSRAMRIAGGFEMNRIDYDVDTLRQVVQSNALLRMPNVIITPHNAFNSQEACQRIVETTFANIHAWLRGEPTNIVNK